MAPDFAAPPEMLGTGTIGTLLVVSAEVTGPPTLLLSFRWLRDGAPIAGAGGPAYAPTDADDLAALRCRVTATNNAGSVSAESPRGIARHAAPRALGLSDRAPETEDDTVIRFDTNVRRFDSTTARFDGATVQIDEGRRDDAPTDRFDSKLLRFDMNDIRFDGAQHALAPPPAIARFDSGTPRLSIRHLTPIL